jgi:hypothetical protein
MMPTSAIILFCSVNFCNLIFTVHRSYFTETLNTNYIFAVMRAWFNCMLIFLISIFCNASAALAMPVKLISPAKFVIVQTATVEKHQPTQHCDQLDDSEVLTAAYSQHSAFGMPIPFVYREIKALIYPNAYSSFTHGQDNVPIQPFYHQLLFPFHGFW